MRPNLSRGKVLMLVLAAAALTACQRGPAGEWRLFGNKPPLSASSVQITRRPTTGEAAGQRQRLQINLETGEAAFIDAQGAVYPHRVSRARAARLRDIITSRVWQVGQQPPAEGASDVVHWTLAAFEDGRAVERPASWARPERKPLPPGLREFERVFERSERYANPLSERVDLLD